MKKEGTETLETEQHIWLECDNNGQSIAWETAKNMAKNHVQKLAQHLDRTHKGHGHHGIQEQLK